MANHYSYCIGCEHKDSCEGIGKWKLCGGHTLYESKLGGRDNENSRQEPNQASD